jgi:anti-sigma regulatory factor (Ser/Thr protein kinase)
MGVVADPVNAATIRWEFADWLGRHFTLDATRTSDVVLAVNEALANAAEYAYVAAPRPGAMHIRAEYDYRRSTLSVTVSDEGTWRADRAPKENKRGRGIPLMHALADQVTLDSSQTGTRVCLEWAQVTAAKSVVHA